MPFRATATVSFRLSGRVVPGRRLAAGVSTAKGDDDGVMTHVDMAAQLPHLLVEIEIDFVLKNERGPIDLFVRRKIFGSNSLIEVACRQIL